MARATGELLKQAMKEGHAAWLIDAAVVLTGQNRQLTSIYRAAQILETAGITWSQVVATVGDEA